MLIFRAEMDYKLTLKLLMNKLLVVCQLYTFVGVVNQLSINYHLNVVSLLILKNYLYSNFCFSIQPITWEKEVAILDQLCPVNPNDGQLLQ